MKCLLASLRGSMKQGQRIPDYAKSEVIDLATRDPRPTNEDIRQVVHESSGLKISARSIGRICKKAGVPRSTKAAQVLANVIQIGGDNEAKTKDYLAVDIFNVGSDGWGRT